MNISTNRVEAFSDCVISIIITIMVFDIKFPNHVQISYTQAEVSQGLIHLLPHIIVYVFSFLVLGIMWLNHHHLFHMVQHTDERFLWLNLNLLFWLSLIPFPTSMLGGNPHLAESTAIYGFVLFMASLSFTFLRGYAIRHSLMHIDRENKLNRTIDLVNKRARAKNYIGMAAYFIAIPLSFVSVYIAYGCFIVPPVLFFIPDGVDDERLAQKIDNHNDNTPKA